MRGRRLLGYSGLNHLGCHAILLHLSFFPDHPVEERPDFIEKDSVVAPVRRMFAVAFVWRGQVNFTSKPLVWDTVPVTVEGHRRFVE